MTPKSLEGKVVLFEFWGTWCEPCHRAIPILRRLAKKMEKDPFVIVGVASDRDEDMLREFLAKDEITRPQLLDDDRSLSFGTFRVTSYPTYLLVDHKGVVVFRDSGFSSRKEAEVSTAVRRALRSAKRDLD